MPLTCNIDATGRRVRRGIGWFSIVLGGALLVATFVVTLPVEAWVVWLVGMLMILLGAFAVWEARVGWCAIRGMGIRTPI